MNRAPQPKAFGERRRTKLIIWATRAFVPRIYIETVKTAVGYWGANSSIGMDCDRLAMRQVYYVAAQALLKR